LRREEVAQLAMISQTYYTYLEQGRAQHPSSAIVRSLAQALRLDSTQTAYLHALTTAVVEPQIPGATDQPVQQLRDVFEAVGDCPAWILNRPRDLLLVNQAATDLIGDWARQPGANFAVWVLLEPAARTVLLDWEMWARTLLARLRAASAGREDSRVDALIARVIDGSDWARAAWDQHEVFSPASEMRFRCGADVVVTRPAFLRTVASRDQEMVVHRIVRRGS
jgi:transcriptional regulator with XRE-family HTH domain